MQDTGAPSYCPDDTCAIGTILYTCPMHPEVRQDRPGSCPKCGMALQALANPGIRVSKVRGYGEYMDFYERDWMSGHVRIEIFTPQSQARAIAEAIMEASHTGLPGDGIVAIQSVETVVHIESRSAMTAEER